jgi:hypothetical protein
LIRAFIAIPIWQAKVLSIGYPPLKSNPGSGAYRNVPWIKLRGHWLEQAGFAIGTPYTIEVYDGKLVFIVDE